MSTATIDKPKRTLKDLEPIAETGFLNVAAIQKLAASLPIKLRTPAGVRLGAGGEDLPGVHFSVCESVLAELNAAIADKVHDLKAKWDGHWRQGKINPTDPAAFVLR